MTAPDRSPPARRKVTTTTLRTLRERGERAVFVTAYDYPTACFAERAGVDMLLVGDSVAMTVLGHPGTVAISMTEMLVFAGAVCRAATYAFVVGDMPFLSYQPSSRDAVRNAGAFVATGCDAVKCEGGARIAPRVRAMTDAGIAVMGHIGLLPQALGPLGGYRAQGKTMAGAEVLLADALALQHAGAFAVLLEAMPPETAQFIRTRVDIPVYGIGAGPHVDGQLVISHDILGTFVGTIRPRFVTRYADVDVVITAAFREYAAQVRSGRFPAAEHCYHLDATESERLAAMSLEPHPNTIGSF